MRVGVLGPLRVVSGGEPIGIGGARLRALLSRLALDAGRVVTVEALCDALWPESVPDNPAHALHSLVARLRRALPDGSAVRSAPAGYRLDLPPDAVDVHCFERLAGEGRRALGDGRVPEALKHLREALDLWRGEALADVPRSPYADGVAVRLEELRLSVLEDRFDAELRTAADPSLTAELQELTAAYPFRERLRGLLITSLHVTGRQPEALTAYETYRRFLADELGTDPGPDLQDLHLAILENKPILENERSAPRGNLWAPMTSFVGRAPERERLDRLLAGNRLVTLVGPGGVGKTRLATACSGDAWLVELAAVTEPGQVPRAVAAALDLHEPGRPSDAVLRLAEALSPTGTRIILDNCEHVIEAAAHLVQELLGRCPGLTILATSREPLGVTGEALCAVPPLPDDLAVRLFLDRARAVRPELEPTAEITTICRRLDGLPLAIELAAARLRSMPLEHLAARLDDRFRLLTGGSRTALPRHRTLRGVVEWSWDLLTTAERDAAERLAVFPAPFAPAAAERAGVPLETLDTLVDKSLLQLDGVRYRMLDTIREYGLERLTSTGRAEPARKAFIAGLLDLAEQAEPYLRGPGQVSWLKRLDAERDNLLAALHLACESGDADPAVRLGAALSHYWTIHGDHTEATTRLRTVLAMPGGPSEPYGPRLTALAAHLLNATFAGELATAAETAETPPADDPAGARVLALKALGAEDLPAGMRALEPHLAHPDAWTRGMTWLLRSFLHGAGSGDTAEGRRDLDSAVAAFRESGERWALSLCLSSIAFAASAAGDFDEAAAALEESARLVRELGGDNQQQVWLPMLRLNTGDVDRAEKELLDVLATSTTPGHIALARMLLGDVARLKGDLDEAARQLDLAAAGEHHDPAFRSLYLCCLGYLAVAQGDLTSGGDHLDAALCLATDMPDMPMVAAVAVGRARLLLRQGRPRRAAEVLGAAHALRGGPDTRHPDVADLTRRLKAHLDAAYEPAYTTGRDHPDPLSLITTRPDRRAPR